MTRIRSVLEWVVVIGGCTLLAVQAEVLEEEFGSVLAYLITAPVAITIGFIACALDRPSKEG